MHRHHKPFQQLVASVLLCSLFLQSCGNSFNQLDFEENQHKLKQASHSLTKSRTKKGLDLEVAFQSALLSQLPPGYELGEAYSVGDCFFDALAQWLNKINHTDVNTDKYLRMLCHEFYQANKKLVADWDLKDNGEKTASEARYPQHEYTYSKILYTADECDRLFNKDICIWGRPWVEGIMLCRKLQLEGICSIEVFQDPETGNPVISYHLVNQAGYQSSISEKDGQALIQEGNIPVIVNVQDKLHFVPLWNEKQREDQEVRVKVFATDLHHAARNGDLEEVQRLLVNVIDINAADQYGWTPLHHAVANNIDEDNAVSIIRLLLDKGAEINTIDNHAIEYGREEVKALLSERGAKMAIVTNKVEKEKKKEEKEKEKEVIPDVWTMDEEQESDTELEELPEPHKIAGLNQPLPIIPQEAIKIHYDKRLGRGGMGEVYEATYQGKRAAAKRLHSPSEETIAAFQKEAKIMDNMRHENIIAFLGFYPQQQQHIFVMEYAPGGSLCNLLQEHKSDKDWDRYWQLRYQIALDVAKGMTYLHDFGVLHRDLKSDNILLNDQGRAQITDFGISLLKTEHSTFGEWDGCTGSYRWMAPEIFHTEKNSKAGDVYSYGMVLWELGAKSQPFSEIKMLNTLCAYIKAGNCETINEHTPELIRKVIELCWLPEPPLKKATDIQDRATMRQVHGLLKEGQPLFLSKQTGKQQEEWLASEATKEPEKGQELPGEHAQTAINKLPKLHSSIQEVKLLHYLPRKAKEQELSQKLKEIGICVVYGHGGVGKSTLVAQYGRSQKDQQAVWWIPAESGDKLITSYENLAQETGIHQEELTHLKKTASHYLQALVRKVYNSLADRRQPALLILDNAVDLSLIEECLENRPSLVEMIVTTRDKRCFENNNQIPQVQLDAFTLEESKEYVKQILQKLQPSEKDIALLIKEVGSIPQKLALATGYINQISFMDVDRYLTKLRVLKKEGKKIEGKLVLPEVNLGLETLDMPSQLMMRYGAYLDPDFIPISLVSSLLRVHDEEELDAILAKLGRLSLITVIQDPGKEGIQIHREIQTACKAYQDWRKGEEASINLGEQDLLVSIIQVLEKYMPDVTKVPDSKWEQARLYAINIASILAYAEEKEMARLELSNLNRCMGSYNRHVCYNYNEALRYYKQSIKILQSLYNIDHPCIPGLLNKIGFVYQDLGNYQKALEYLEEALEMNKHWYNNRNEGRNLKVANSLNNIGKVYQNLGQHQEALKYLQKALDMRQALYAGDHPDIATSLNNIGSVYCYLGKNEEALEYLKKALVMRQALFGSNHQDIANSLNNIGKVYQNLGGHQHQEALKYLKQALEMRQALFKGNHQDIANSLNNVGSVYKDLGQPNEALAHHEQALEMRQAIFKGNHQDIANSLYSIGIVYYDLDKDQEGLKYLEEAHEMKESLKKSEISSRQERERLKIMREEVRLKSLKNLAFLREVSLYDMREVEIIEDDTKLKGRYSPTSYDRFMLYLLMFGALSVSIKLSIKYCFFRK